MIPLSAQRAADRRRCEGLIAARPSPATFRNVERSVRLLDEPQRQRSMRQAGFDPGYTTEILLVLPLDDTTPPVPAREYITVTDFSGAPQAFKITGVQPLLGTHCYRCALIASKTKVTPPTPAP